MKKLFIILLLSIYFFGSSIIVFGASINTLSGMILLQVQANGEAWYVNPSDSQRHYLGRPSDAFDIMRELGLGIKHDLLNSYQNSTFPNKLSGKIMLDVEKNGEAYYVYPKDLKGYYLGRPSDAFAVMRELGLGITNSDLSKIPKKDTVPNNEFSTFENKNIITPVGDFEVNLITIKRDYQNLKIFTSTGDSYNCNNNCTAKPLMEYYDEFNGFASINGAYFCPPDYNACQSEVNFYYSPFYNSATKFWANEERLKWTEGPIIIIDENNQPYFFLRTNTVYTPEQFESQYKTKIQAALSNGPALIQNKQNIVQTQPMDDKQKNLKSYRGGFGYDDQNFYLITVKNATVPDLATVFYKLGVTNAINLDGGGSSAMIYNNQYVIGPRRNIPTAIIFAEQ